MTVDNISQTRIRHKVLIPLAMVILLMLIVLVSVEHHEEYAKLSEQHLKQKDNVRRILNELMNDHAMMFNGLAKTLGEDPRLQNAFLQRDRQQLLALSRPIFDNVCPRYCITYFNFHDLDGTCFLRLHHTPRFGDKISGDSMTKAQSTGYDSSGVDVSSTGNLTLRTVHPWRIDGNVVGYIEMGEEFFHLTRHLNTLLGVDIMVLLDKSQLKREQWNSGVVNRIGLPKDWNWLHDHVVIDSTLNILPGSFNDSFADSCKLKSECKETPILNIENQKYIASHIPLRNATEDVVGKVFVLENITAQTANIKQVSIIYIGVVLVGGGLTFGFFFVYLGRVQRRLVKTYRDQHIEIVHRRFAEAQLTEAKERAEIANRSKSEFLSNMSHELRTPMNAIIGFSNLLKEESLTEEQMDYVVTISASSQHLLSLINDILDLSKIEAGKLSITSDQCAINELLTKIDSMMRPQIEAKGLGFEISMDPDLPEEITTDTRHLYQCLINLVGNAAKFTDEGRIRVSAGNVQKDGINYIRFDVSDTGIGIPPEKQKLVFESFEQADNSTSRKYGGTGLGLSISHQLIAMMGGELTVASEEGVGSTFTIIIPMASPVVIAQPL